MGEPHPHPDHLWRNPEPKRAYEVVIVGAGGHGLATAYYLAKNHGITDVAVLDRGWLAGGNMARNTTVIRSNYLRDESAAIYEHSLKLWEHLSEAIVNISPDVRYPVIGGTLQRRGGIAKHDYVAWAFARKADEMGVDLIQNCEVSGFDLDGGRVRGVHTNRGLIAANKVALCAAGHSSVLADMIGLELPIQSHPLQALVSELLEPFLNCVVMSTEVHVYVSQAHKGELVMGAGIDPYNSYAQRGSPHVIEDQLAAACELFPIFSRAHVLRTWAGIVDVAPDASPILGLTPIENLFINCGWGTGGFKATPGAGWVYSHTHVRRSGRRRLSGSSRGC